MYVNQLGQPSQTFIDVDGTEKITDLLYDLLNSYPGLKDGQIKFGELTETAGLGFFSSSGSALIEDWKDVLGHTYQVCSYPFEIIYRSSPKNEEQRVKIKEFLDGLGRWLEKQPVKIGDETYTLEEWPDIQSGNRIIREVYRTTTGHLQSAYQDGIEDWGISIAVEYENYF